MARDIALENQLWQDPDWTCPNCGFVNRAIRSRCRNFACNKHVDELFPGEGLLVGCFEVGEDGALIAAEIDRLQRKAETDRLALEAHRKQVVLDELLKQPTSDSEKFVRCKWCGQEMPKPHPSITTPVCLDCIPF